MAVSCGLYRAAYHVSWQQARAYYKYVYTYFNQDMNIRISDANQGGWMDVYIKNPDASTFPRMFAKQKTELLHMADRIMARHGIIAEDVLDE